MSGWTSLLRILEAGHSREIGRQEVERSRGLSDVVNEVGGDKRDVGRFWISGGRAADGSDVVEDA